MGWVGLGWVGLGLVWFGLVRLVQVRLGLFKIPPKLGQAKLGQFLKEHPKMKISK